MPVQPTSDLHEVPLADWMGLIAPIADLSGIDRLPLSLRILLENVMRRTSLK